MRAAAAKKIDEVLINAEVYPFTKTRSVKEYIDRKLDEKKPYKLKRDK